MTFDEALKKLRRLAKNDYCHLIYGVSWHKNYKIGKEVIIEEPSIEISCYVHNYKWTQQYNNFDDALSAMKRRMMHSKKRIPEADPQTKDKGENQ